MLNDGVSIDPRSVMIATYAMCGFANFSSIAIQIGGIGGIAPSRRSELAKLGLLGVLAGTLATFQSATIAGMLVSKPRMEMPTKTPEAPITEEMPESSMHIRQSFTAYAARTLGTLELVIENQVDAPVVGDSFSSWDSINNIAELPGNPEKNIYSEKFIAGR